MSDTVFYDHIPSALRRLDQWCLWRAEERQGRLTKVPYQPNGQRASTTDARTWGSLHAVQEARWACIGKPENPAYDGVGFIFSADDPYFGIDLDHCRGADWALELAAAIPTYWEITPSWTGYHLIGQGTIPDGKGHRKGAIEVYDRGRYFTMTGVYGPGPWRDVTPVQPQLDDLLQRLAPPRPSPAKPRRPAGDWHPGSSVMAVLIKALQGANGPKIRRLYDGDRSGYDSPSEADLALVQCFAFYTRDPIVLDMLLRQSGLMRDDKTWDSPRGDSTYGQITIDRALSLETEQFGGELPRDGYGGTGL